jgi:hypothetical protein
MKTFWARAVVLLGCVALFAGCGHYGAAHKLSLAQEALAKAKAASAETKAPADYYMAQEYLMKAEHEVQEGDRSFAKEMAGKSMHHSQEALRKAGGGAK